MDKQAATRLITETFNQPFDKQRFQRFTHELLNRIDVKPNRWSGQVIPDAFKDHISTYERIGTYTDPKKLELDVLMVRLKHEDALHRARTMQRNFVAHYLKTRGEREAALVAYYADGQPDWRFSLVQMEYKARQDAETGRVKVEEQVTPARRSSFLVGKNEPNHTAQQQLLPVLEYEQDLTLDRLQDAFSIETVTKEFFNRYKDHFLLLQDELERIVARDVAIRSEFARCQIDTTIFAKKLLGQLVFLYFLQKKGWLGVQPGAAWGSGHKKFLSELFKQNQYKNFFNDVLEPLFYQALANERPDNLYAPLRCQIPFLNGGLFEPTGGYNWQGKDILIDNAIFAGIFETFDRYNFTVREDEPLEKEVAVDPEMLGKVFENLLDVRERKDKGAFYTPREIVHYMCQESLINYLDTTLNLREVPSVVSGALVQKPLFGEPAPRQTPLMMMEYTPVVLREDLAHLIRLGEQSIEHEAAIESGTKSYKPRLPQSVRAYARQIDDALADIKICDPAIGSGAFPVGMMHEIVRAREALTIHLKRGERSTYSLKRHAIQESLYGVDIDQSAVDVAKLRLWLSLVVDEDNYHSIKPLPNLDYKIVCGNSLVKVEKTLFNNELLHKLQERQAEYITETKPVQKQQQRTIIRRLIAQISGDEGSFDFEVYFSEVFEAKGGFDVVIGNPPYVRQELISAFKPMLQRNFPKVYQSSADIFVYFYAKGIDILRPHGTLAFITSNKFMRARYGKSLRTFLGKEMTLRTMIDFGDLPVFEATAYPCITIMLKQLPTEYQQVNVLNVPKLEILHNLQQAIMELAWQMPQASLESKGWNLERQEVLNLVEKIRCSGKPLGEYVNKRFYRGITTGLNEAFVVDHITRDRLIREHPSSGELLKSFLRGRDVKRWQVEFAKQYLIKIESSENKKHAWSGKSNGEAEKIFSHIYPAIYSYLQQFRSSLIKRDDQGQYFWELRSCKYWVEFDQPKIILGRFMNRPTFAFDQNSFYHNDALYMIPNANECIVAVLNSSVSWWFLTQLCTDLQNGYLQAFKEDLFQIPIPYISEHVEQLLTALVKRILFAKRADPAADVFALEREIDCIVYALYGLTDEEIAIVEGRSA